MGWNFEGALHSDGADASGVVFDPSDTTLLTGDDIQAVLEQADVLLKAAADATSDLTTVVAGKAPTVHTHTSSQITDFVEAAQDAINSLLQSASGVTLNYNDAANTLTISGGGDATARAEEIRDQIGIALIGSGLVNVVVNDALDTITITTTATQNQSDAVTNAAIDEKADQTDLEGHIDNPTGAHSASAVSLDTDGMSHFSAEDVQGAFSEAATFFDYAQNDLSTEITNRTNAINAHVQDAVSAHEASAISVDSSDLWYLSSTDVQTMFHEVDRVFDDYATDIDNINAVLTDKADTVHTHTSAQITDFTEAAQDAIAALLAGTSGVTLNYNDAANTLTITGAGDSSALAEQMRDTIGVAMIGAGLISVAVNDAADTITISTTATANSTDASLRDRSTHTGSQAQSTITGLVTALGNLQPLDSDLTDFAALAPADGFIPVRVGGHWTAINGTPAAIGAIAASLVDAKGDILIGTANDTPARLPVGTNGQELVADSTKASGLRYTDRSRGGTRKMTSGLYYGPGVHSPGTGSFSQDIPNATLFVVPEDTTFDRIACEVIVGAASAVCRLSIYANDPTTDTPLNTSSGLILDALTVSAATAGAKEITISQLLVAGSYWLVGTPQIASGATYRTIGTVSDPLIGQQNNTTTAGQGVNCIQLNTTTGAMPTTPPSIISRTVGGMKIVLRAA